jgi:hypothetical protein
MKRFDDAWRAWIGANADCPRDLLFKVLHDSGFAYRDICEELGHEPTVPLGTIFGPLAASAPRPVGATPAPHSSAPDPLDRWLGPRRAITAPETVRRWTRRQQEDIPHLGAGGPGCPGFERRALPSALLGEIQASFAESKSRLIVESGPVESGHLSTMHRDLPPSLLAENAEFNKKVAETLKVLHEEWCGFELEASACYGVRVYLHGAYLHVHVDRPETHVVSSTLCVDRDVHSPWPLEIEGVDGTRAAVDLEPGEFVLYESARVAHGRPTPLSGRFHAGLFVHYRPAVDADLWAASPREWFREHGTRRT